AASGGNASGSSPAAAAAAAVPRATGLIDLAEKPRSAKATPLGDGRYLLDQFGAVCPFPLIEAKDVMATLKPGERLVVDFDCVQATDSLPRWAAEEGYEVTDFQQTGNAGWRIEIEKR
ncbi:sulfurtransferase TusA family protein, partial [Corynebacterium otitidis]